VGKLIGLAVFAADALSSTAYATQEILLILAVAGTAAFGYAFPISIAIVLLIAIVVVSYEQTIEAYPGGGGAYIVALENLGKTPALTAGSALLIDYILTVAVSISSGVAQIVSAFPVLFEFRVELAIVLVALVTVLNLRGVRESGATFTTPAYLFLGSIMVTVLVGLFQALTGSLGTVSDPPHLVAEGVLQVVTPFLLLHAFASGTSAMTGIEAIANGVTAFRAPSSRNARIVLVWMGAILSFLFLGITYLAWQTAAIPSEVETVISQVARTVYGGEGVLYLVVVAMTAIILILAANTAFAGFPRLAAILASDSYLPRQFTYRGSRLVFSKGIVALGVLAAWLIIIFGASVSRMIPLYAIGVFLSFTLSQLGMARRWGKAGHLPPGQTAGGSQHSAPLEHERNYLVKMVVNGIGAVCTGIVAIVFAVTKFADGAWIVLLLIPVSIFVFSAINRHYLGLASQLSLQNYAPLPQPNRYRVILPIGGVHKGTLEALEFAQSLSPDVTAVYISMDEQEAQKIESKWDTWGNGVRLVVLQSPYRLLIEPLLEYINALYSIRQQNDVLVIVMPQFVSRSRWTWALHNQTALFLRMSLLLHPGIVVVEVPYQVE